MMKSPHSNSAVSPNITTTHDKRNPTMATSKRMILNKQSFASARLDQDGKGYLNEVEKLCRKYDQKGDGRYSIAEVKAIVTDLKSREDDIRFYKKALLISICIGVALFAMMLGAVLGGIELSKDVTASSDDGVMRVYSYDSGHNKNESKAVSTVAISSQVSKMNLLSKEDGRRLNSESGLGQALADIPIAEVMDKYGKLVLGSELTISVLNETKAGAGLELLTGIRVSSSGVSVEIADESYTISGIKLEHDRFQDKVFKIHCPMPESDEDKCYIYCEAGDDCLNLVHHSTSSSRQLFGTVQQYQPSSIFQPPPFQGLFLMGTGNADGCFPTNAKVELQNGVIKEIWELRVGDVVRSSSSSFSKVFAFGHQENYTTDDYIELETYTNSESHTLLLSPDHFIELDGLIQFAKQVHLIEPENILTTLFSSHILHVEMLNDNCCRFAKPGMLIKFGDGSTHKLKNVSYTKALGLHAPYTEDGRIVVNGFQTSVGQWAPKVDFGLFKISGNDIFIIYHAPLRLATRIIPSISSPEWHDDVSGQHIWTTMLLSTWKGVDESILKKRSDGEVHIFDLKLGQLVLGAFGLGALTVEHILFRFNVLATTASLMVAIMTQSRSSFLG